LRRPASRAHAGRNTRGAGGACTFRRESLRHRSKVLALSPADLGKPSRRRPRHRANVAIVDRFADIDRLPEPVADLIRRQVAL